MDDYGDGSFNGATFFESFRYKYNKREQRWENAENSKLGALTEVRKPRYFEDASIPDLTEDDLEEFELECRVKPRKTPDGRVTGSTIAWETMRPVQTAKAKARAMSQAEAEEDDDFTTSSGK